MVTEETLALGLADVGLAISDRLNKGASAPSPSDFLDTTLCSPRVGYHAWGDASYFRAVGESRCKSNAE